MASPLHELASASFDLKWRIISYEDLFAPRGKTTDVHKASIVPSYVVCYSWINSPQTLTISYQSKIRDINRMFIVKWNHLWLLRPISRIVPHLLAHITFDKSHFFSLLLLFLNLTHFPSSVSFPFLPPFFLDCLSWLGL